MKVTSYLVLDEAEHLLTDLRTQEQVVLTFSEAAVLAALLTHYEQVLDKDTLLAAGWPDRVVAPTSLTQCISTLRKKLSPYPEIKLHTLARMGYQLQVEEEEIETQVQPEAIIKPRSRKRLYLLFALILLTIVALGYGLMQSKGIQWKHEDEIPLNIGGVRGEAELFYPKGTTRPAPWRWQKHIAPESNQIPNMSEFSAFALADDNAYSMAICPTGDYRNCDGSRLMNIVAVDDQPAGLHMTEFIPLMQKMEKRVRYNRITIPEGMCKKSDFNEHNYQADVYFPVANKLLERYDLNMSLVYDDDNSGSFYFSSCLTDQDCLTAPIKYTFRGDFVQHKAEIGHWNVDVFNIKVKCKNLYNPEKINTSAAYFFRNIRKDDIQDDELTFYRLYQNNASAIWIVPRMGNIVVWSRYKKVGL
ncbi:winged helix-turn-helix domain-containing protein [Shewanella corallii]|uniref:Winged helix-turn-helix domain-containing protein n=1 Tax=Shewanella corallii TaxID=560080 RepID=A0ABT0N7X8_9GAMM|nr:winged helix-turn-helix domain-containing protein [Shewanella corallii]MCL2913927.1 winged helix-turn-helix domain-containing protein [Shewanella corallii]